MPERPDLVINTGPILALIAAGHLEVLPALFSRVIVPYEVAREVEAGGGTQFGSEEFQAANGWINVTVLPN